MGDSRQGPMEPLSPVFKRIVQESQSLPIQRFFHTGDVVYGLHEPIEETDQGYQRVFRLLKTLPVPFTIVPGNHEYATKACATLFYTYAHQPPYFSFDDQGIHFIALNTELPGQQSAIRGKQLAWLKQDLDSHPTARATFVFLHQPLFSPLNSHNPIERLMVYKDKGYTSFISERNRNALAAVFSHYHVNTVFAGHEHLYYQTTDHGVRYVITGGGGAPLYASPAHGGFYHYLLVTVDGQGKVKLTLHRI
jgi:3',5'-cyclic AMP phosphodiesterase CpdA